MSNLIANKELASEYLDIALENNEFQKFLTGNLAYELVVKDSYGKNVFSAMHVMEAIYDKHKQNPNLRLDGLTFNTMVNVLRTRRNASDILNILSDIEYQMNAEKNNTAAFNVNCLNLLVEIRQNLERNKEFYQSSIEVNQGIWNEIQLHNMTLEQITGHKVL